MPGRLRRASRAGATKHADRDRGVRQLPLEDRKDDPGPAENDDRVSEDGLDRTPPFLANARIEEGITTPNVVAAGTEGTRGKSCTDVTKTSGLGKRGRPRRRRIGSFTRARTLLRPASSRQHRCRRIAHAVSLLPWPTPVNRSEGNVGRSSSSMPSFSPTCEEISTRGRTCALHGSSVASSALR